MANPTTRLSVPNLTALLARLRNEELRRCVTFVHAKKEGEGEWVLGTAAARLMRGKVKIFGPEAGTIVDLVEHALRIGAKVLFAGEVRRDEDGRAMRQAASLGVRPVGVITCIRLVEAQMRLKEFGPWTGYDVALLSSDSQPA